MGKQIGTRREGEFEVKRFRGVKPTPAKPDGIYYDDIAVKKPL